MYGEVFVNGAKGRMPYGSYVSLSLLRVLDLTCFRFSGESNPVGHVFDILGAGLCRKGNCSHRITYSPRVLVLLGAASVARFLLSEKERCGGCHTRYVFK